MRERPIKRAADDCGYVCQVGLMLQKRTRNDSYKVLQREIHVVLLHSTIDVAKRGSRERFEKKHRHKEQLFD